MSWHQLAHSLAASAKEQTTAASGADNVAAEDALQSTMETLLTELGAALVPITDAAPADAAAAAAGDCCGPAQASSLGDAVCCREMISPTLFGDDHVAAIHSLRYAVEGLPLFVIAQRAWTRVKVSHASPFNPPMCVITSAILSISLLPKTVAPVQFWFRASACCSGAAARPVSQGQLPLLHVRPFV